MAAPVASSTASPPPPTTTYPDFRTAAAAAASFQSMQQDHDDLHDAADKPRCWICHSTRRRSLLSNFCLCRGSLGFAHQTCMQKLCESQEINACLHCKARFEFMTFAAQDGHTPPPMPTTVLGQLRLLLWDFLLPFVWAAFITGVELALHWVATPLLAGALLLGMRGSCPDHSVYDAWLIGLFLCLLKRKVYSGSMEVDKVVAERVAEAETLGLTAESTAEELMLAQQQLRNQQREIIDAVLRDGNRQRGAAREPAQQQQQQPDQQQPDQQQQEEEHDADNDEAATATTTTASATDDSEEDDDDTIADAVNGTLTQGQTIDRLLWSWLSVLIHVARYPRCYPSALDAFHAAFSDDVPVILVHALSIGLCPLLFVAYYAVHVVWNTIRCRPPTLAEPRNRFHEASLRIGTETSRLDKKRYVLILGMDMVVLYFALPLLIGIVAHEALGPSPTAMVSGVARRFTEGIERPWTTAVHWLLGYVVAGLVSAIESQFVAPLFAPGVSLIFFRAIQITNEHATYLFMLVQLFDISALGGLRHMFILFSTYVPLVGCCVFLLTNSVRLAYSIGNVIIWMWTLSSAANSAAAAAAAAGQNNNQQQQQHIVDGTTTSTTVATFSSLLSHISDYVSDVFFYLSHHRTPAFPSTWFFVVIVGFLVAGGAFWGLPNQYLVLRDIIPLARRLARSLGLERYLFDEAQQGVVDNFLEVSATMPLDAEAGIELIAPAVPIEQTAIRRERFLDEDDIPSYLRLRVLVLTVALMARLFLSWCRNLLVPVLLMGLGVGTVQVAWSVGFGAVAAAALEAGPGGGGGGAKTGSESWAVSTTVMMMPSSFSSSPSPSATSPTATRTTTAAAAGSAASDSSTVILSGLMDALRRPVTPLSGLELLAAGLLLSLRNFPAALLVALGYTIVTPVALLFGLLDMLKPALVNLGSTVENVWISAFNVRRIIVPRTTPGSQN